MFIIAIVQIKCLATKTDSDCSDAANTFTVIFMVVFSNFPCAENAIVNGRKREANMIEHNRQE